MLLIAFVIADNTEMDKCPTLSFIHHLLSRYEEENNNKDSN